MSFRAQPFLRNPHAFFVALARCRDAGRFESQPVRVVLRATGSDDVYRPMIAELGLESIVIPGARDGYALAYRLVRWKFLGFQNQHELETSRRDRQNGDRSLHGKPRHREQRSAPRSRSVPALMPT